MTDRWRFLANLATLGNGLAGVGSILYVLAGNKIWGMLLIAIGVGLDGLDGIFARRSAIPSGPFGRIADSVADGITFGLAPGFLVAVHTNDVQLWQPWLTEALLVGALVAAFAIARLTYFTWKGYQQPYFLGVPSPQSALAIVAVGLLLDVPAFLGGNPPVLLFVAALIAVAMVIPVRYPKIRRGATLRIAMGVTAGALALALVPLQFFPPTGSPAYVAAFGATLVSVVGLAAYYLVGPLTVDAPPKTPAVT